MANYLITGANRGIGFEMTKQLAARGDYVVALCRDPKSASALAQVAEQHGKVLIVQALVTDEESVAAAAERISAEIPSIDVLINNAGMLIRNEPIDEFASDGMRETFDVNVVGPMHVTKHFLPLLRKGDNARLVNISSQLGSLDSLGRGRSGIYSYNASKAALNMLTRMLSHDLRDDGIAVVSVHPGWVQTDMGGASAAITPEQSAGGIIKVTDGLDMTKTNKFFVYDGSEHAW